MKAVIMFMTGEPYQLVVLLDNMCARQFALRQGVSELAKDESCGFRMQFGKAGCRSPESTRYEISS